MPDHAAPAEGLPPQVRVGAWRPTGASEQYRHAPCWCLRCGCRGRGLRRGTSLLWAVTLGDATAWMPRRPTKSRHQRLARNISHVFVIRSSSNSNGIVNYGCCFHKQQQQQHPAQSKVRGCVVLKESASERGDCCWRRLARVLTSIRSRSWQARQEQITDTRQTPDLPKLKRHKPSAWPPPSSSASSSGKASSLCVSSPSCSS